MEKITTAQNAKNYLGAAIYDVYDMDKCIEKAITSIQQIKTYKKSNVKDPDFSDFPDSLIQTTEKLISARQKRQKLESGHPLEKAKTLITGKLRNAKEEEKRLVYQLKDDFISYLFKKDKAGFLEKNFTKPDKKLSMLREIGYNLDRILDSCRKEDEAYPWEGAYTDSPSGFHLGIQLDYTSIPNVYTIKNK